MKTHTGSIRLMLFFLIAILELTFSQAGATSLFKGTANPVTASLFSDKRARNVGDIINVIISESSRTANSGKTTLSKKSSVASTIKSLLFPTASAPTAKTDPLYANAPYIGSRLGTHRGTLPDSNWNSEADFEGDGALSSSDTITGNITAMILEVLPNGNFIIEGRRQVNVDKQERIIVLSGIVRPEDIGADNSILSRYVADAKITLEGKGPLNDQRKKGWITKIWEKLGLY